MSIRVSIIGSSNIAFDHLKALNEVGFTRIQNTNSESKVNSVLIAAKFDYDVELFDELGENQQLKPSAYPLN